MRVGEVAREYRSKGSLIKMERGSSLKFCLFELKDYGQNF